MSEDKILSVYISHLSCDGWQSGSSVMLTFGVDGAPPKRTAFITITGAETNVGSRLEFAASAVPSSVQVHPPAPGPSSERLQGVKIGDAE
jgi:hypothetical protein